MKYMGSKRQMLRNGLGETLDRTVSAGSRFVDLFTGSAAVARHVAEKYAVPVIAVDLQSFCVVLAEATLLRDQPIDFSAVSADWIKRAETRLHRSIYFDGAVAIQEAIARDKIADNAASARNFAADTTVDLCRAYGGWYYSPLQALLIDALRQELPSPQEHGAIALAALISASSRCAAAPGHTAQPFNPDTRAGKFVFEAWSRDLMSDLCKSCDDLSAGFSQSKGAGVVSDAKVFAKQLNEGDVVFIDPPYSAVHYSRFYHVLESIARGHAGPVLGSGRYPAIEHRPSSQFSIKTQACHAISGLLKQVSTAKARAVVTFPLEQASNGVSGSLIRNIAQENFHIEQEKISSTFSTLGGDTVTRKARKSSVELILSLAPRR